ncbi:MAG: endolytic transglycosylase MltG [Anaerolineae bacterium]
MSDRLRALARGALILVAVVAILAIAGIGMRVAIGRSVDLGGEPTPALAGQPQAPDSLTRVVLGLYLSLHQAELSQAADPGNTQTMAFSIAPGETAGTIASRLQSMGLINDANVFEALVRYRGVDSALQVGDYELAPSMTLEEIVMALQHGQAAGIVVTIPEGWRLEQVAARLAQAGLGTEDEYLSLMRRNDYPYSFLKNWPAEAPATLEGYLFPDTYEFPADAKPAAVVDIMLRNFDRRVPLDLRKALTDQGLSLHEAIVLASIVEREAVKPEERPLIAAVFLGRLDRGMMLQADPTVSYAKSFDLELGRWWPPMAMEDTENIDSPYNTFQYRGLPPGPICSPGLGAIQGVAKPERTDYLYFVSRGDGTHAFSVTYEEHLQNVAKFNPSK